jgi:hypothetical protein
MTSTENTTATTGDRRAECAALSTPRPWDYVPSTEHHGPYITSDHGGTIADLYTMSQPGVFSTASGGPSKPIPFFHEMADPNAELIVRAVNSHDALVSALERIAYSAHADNAPVLRGYALDALTALAKAR